MSESTSSDDLEFFEVVYFQVQVKYSIEQGFDELAEPLLLFVSSGCNNPDHEGRKREKGDGINDQMRASGNSEYKENSFIVREVAEKWSR